VPDTRLLNIGGVPCTIALEGLGEAAVVEHAGPEGATADVVFQCNYGDRFLLLRALRGTVAANGRAVVRTLPYQYPAAPNLYCTGVDPITLVKPMRDANGWVIGELARLTAHFEAPKWQFVAGDPAGQNDPSGQAWTTTKLKTTAEVFTPPAGAYFIGPFTPTGTAIEESSVGVVRPKTEISMTRKMLPFTPLQEIDAAEGKVNLYPVQVGNKVYAPGFVLFITGNTEPGSDVLGDNTYDVEYMFIANSDYDWNTYQSKTGAWQKLNTKADGSGKPPFASADFALLP